MSPLKTSVIAALVSAALTAGALHFLQRSRSAEAAGLRASNARIRFEASQRRPASHPPVETVPAAPREPIVQPPPPAARPAEDVAGDYRNEGRSTPLATLQTFAWACDRADTETVARLLCFEGAGRAKAEALRAALPAETRAQWPTPEAMAASLLTAQTMNQPFPHATLLERATPEAVSHDRVMLRLPGTPKDRTQYQKFDDGWKYVITEAVVDDYIRRTSTAAASR